MHNRYHLDTNLLAEHLQKWGSVKTLVDKDSLGLRHDFSLSSISYRKPHHSGKHEDFETILILEGSGTASVGWERIAIKPGSLLLIPPGTEHGIASIESGPIKAILNHF